MDDAALERVQQRISAASTSTTRTVDLEAAIDGARAQIEALATATGELEATLTGQIGAAVRTGLRTEVLPVARHIAELRGLFNQANRRLERIEADLLAERKARVDDLALLVELVSSGWRGVDSRLARLESSVDDDRRVEQLPAQNVPDATPDDAIVDQAA